MGRVVAHVSSTGQALRARRWIPAPYQVRGKLFARMTEVVEWQAGCGATGRRFSRRL